MWSPWDYFVVTDCENFQNFPPPDPVRSKLIEAGSSFHLVNSRGVCPQLNSYGGWHQERYKIEIVGAGIIKVCNSQDVEEVRNRLVNLNSSFHHYFPDKSHNQEYVKKNNQVLPVLMPERRNPRSMAIPFRNEQQNDQDETDVQDIDSQKREPEENQ